MTSQHPRPLTGSAPHAAQERHTARPPGDEAESERRRAILHAAVKVFGEKGYEGCRIADIARQAGVAYGLVYHYFRSKEELLEHVLAEQWAVFIEALERIAGGPAPATEQLTAMCDFAVEVFRTAPAVVRVVLLEVARTPNALRSGSTRQAFEHAVNIIAGVIRRGQERGEIRRSADPMITAAGVLGAMEMSLTGLVLGVVGAEQDEDVQRVKRGVVDLMLRGVSAR